MKKQFGRCRKDAKGSSGAAAEETQVKWKWYRTMLFLLEADGEAFT